MSGNCPAGLETSRNCPAGLGRQVRTTWREVEGQVRIHYRTRKKKLAKKKKIEKFSKSKKKIFVPKKNFFFCSKSSKTSKKSISGEGPKSRRGGACMAYRSKQPNSYALHMLCLHYIQDISLLDCGDHNLWHNNINIGILTIR